MTADEGKMCYYQLPHHNVPICLHYTSRSVTNTMMNTICNAIKFDPRSIVFLVPSRCEQALSRCTLAASSACLGLKEKLSIAGILRNKFARKLTNTYEFRENVREVRKCVDLSSVFN